MTQTELRETIWNRARADAANEITAALSAVSAHNKLVADLTARCLLPGQAAAMIKHLEQNHLSDPTPTRLQAHAHILNDLGAVAANLSVQLGAKKSANDLFLAAEQPLLAMEAAVGRSLDAQAGEFIAQETAFYAGFGFTSVESQFSRLFNSLKASIRNQSLRSGKEQILSISAHDYTPRFELSSYAPLFQGQA